MSDPSLSVYPLGHSVNFTSSKESDKVVHGTTGEIVLQELPGVGYRLYKMRFAGLIALVAFNIVCAMNWVLFSAISINTAAHFRISLTQVNWLANIVCGMYIFVAPFVPALVQRFSIRGVSFIAAGFLLVGSWLRFASTSGSLDNKPGAVYALLFLGSACVGISQCIFQIIPPSFSETWFGLQSRTTMTMLIAVSNPFGGAIGQLLAPAIVSTPNDLKNLLLIIAIVTSAVSPLAFIITARPPTPPTRSAEGRRDIRGQSIGILQSLKVLVVGGGKGESLSGRQRLDFGIIALAFATIVGFFDAFLTLTNEIFEPVGYTSDMSGYIGAAVIVSGLVAAGLSAPLFDRVFQFRLALAAKLLVPIIGISFFALIWAVKPHDLGGIFAIAVLTGTSAFTMLPVALELAAEVCWPVLEPNVTSAILYLLANGFSVVTVVGMNALQAPSTATPPRNMKKALIFEGVFVLAVSFVIFGLRGIQGRKLSDVTL